MSRSPWTVDRGGQVLKLGRHGMSPVEPTGLDFDLAVNARN